MPGWKGSERREGLPSDWAQIRARILKRDQHRCTHTNDYGARCSEPATDVDHIIPGNDHSPGNLRSLCSWHHDKKSGAEGARAAAANRRRHDKKFRRGEQHPGLL
ncbi:HNH endonuclease [Streptomyces phage Celia]|uniref:HNH endonuclease n=1 Tax=Streptomyces phage Celia TaxID=2590946 RepID=A0A516KR85_9CAUD|nr:HNH endonuclease [Streptomyces phage Celia]QDP44206.1 HNH endonuclease [Streptomyces phage Celia]QFG10466.1 HNH endonuclease [Streptomyces phage Urza]QJD50568.1 HNH endonuclease [Streptomyces phage Itza]